MKYVNVVSADLYMEGAVRLILIVGVLWVTWTWLVLAEKILLLLSIRSTDSTKTVASYSLTNKSSAVTTCMPSGDTIYALPFF